jgi:hypothetical protein
MWNEGSSVNLVMSYGRSLLLREFKNTVLPHLAQHDVVDICVIGGYVNEPEVKLLIDSGVSVRVTTVGIDDSDFYLDLNILGDEFPDVNFHLVLFSQTLEHVWNHAASFANISKIAKSKSLLWVSCPASNRHHGSPDYFSAGFTPNYLERNFQEFGFSLLSSGELGSIRNYIATHTLPYWLSERAHSFPILFGAESYRPFSRAVLTAITFPIRLILSLTPSRETNNPRWVTESWALFISK